MEKKLYRSTSQKMLLGVCAGLGEYFNIDATIIRVAFALGALITALVPGMILYFILGFIIPVQGEVSNSSDQF
ncbi:MAG: PspC domain-containing protein [Rhizobacter sp.]|nr:PspC domain-containing protein [Chlorobiales bacterium]